MAAKSKVRFDPAPEVKEIAEDLIVKYHPHLLDPTLRIEYIFISKTPKSKGREVWGTCRKVTSLNAFLANEQEGSDPFFVITISAPIWDQLPLDKKQALVDHELCHAEVIMNDQDDDEDGDEPYKLSIRPHDMEEFSCIVRRHGLWREDVESFIREATKKSKTDEGDEDDGEPDTEQE